MFQHEFLTRLTQDTVTFVATGNVFDPETAAKMKEFILAPGNSTDRAEAYRTAREQQQKLYEALT